jgi:hypothetical protein
MHSVLTVNDKIRTRSRPHNCYGGKAMLIYDIQSELLHGDVGGRQFRVHAVSGGGRGSKLKPEGDELMRSWSFWTKEIAAHGREKRVRGGVIPPGVYTCRYVQHHPTFHECIYLEQTVTSLLASDPVSPTGVRLHGRDGFYIHASGPKGSDGCIVVPDEAQRRCLNQVIRDHNGTALRVVSPYLPDDISPRKGTALA